MKDIAQAARDLLLQSEERCLRPKSWSLGVYCYYALSTYVDQNVNALCMSNTFLGIPFMVDENINVSDIVLNCEFDIKLTSIIATDES